MIRTLFIAVGVLALCAAAAAAQAGKDTGLSSWLRDLQKKIDALSPRKAPTVPAGVAGVRGAKEDNARPKLYWKGKGDEEALSEEELQEFREGFASAKAGKRTEAVRELEEFMKRYPDSVLIPDAKKTTDLMKAEDAAEPGAEPAAQTRK